MKAKDITYGRSLGGHRLVVANDQFRDASKGTRADRCVIYYKLDTIEGDSQPLYYMNVHNETDVDAE